MSQPIELILVRHLASSLTIPLFVVDPEGTMVFFNEPAERLLGRRFDDAGEMPLGEWTSAFGVRGAGGRPMPAEQLPLVQALRTGHPAHARFSITGLDGAERSLEVSAFPLEGQGQRQLGAVALFWEAEGEPEPETG